MRWGNLPSEGRITMPSVGPERLANRSYCIEWMTLGKRPNPSSSYSVGSESAYPSERMMALT